MVASRVHVYSYCWRVIFSAEARLVLAAVGCGQTTDTASAPTGVTAFLGRWRVHGLDGAAITPELKESVGIGDVFVVMPVEGTTPCTAQKLRESNTRECASVGTSLAKKKKKNHKRTHINTYMTC